MHGTARTTAEDQGPITSSLPPGAGALRLCPPPACPMAPATAGWPLPDGREMRVRHWTSEQWRACPCRNRPEGARYADDPGQGVFLLEVMDVLAADGGSDA